MKKKNVILLMIPIFIICLFLFKPSNTKNNAIQYITAIQEINDILNENPSDFLSDDLENKRKSITINTNTTGTMSFQNDSILKDLNDPDTMQLHFSSDYNFITVLKMNHNQNIMKDISFDQFNHIKGYDYLVDDLENPIVSLSTGNNSVLYCKNLESNTSRNYSYYKLDNNEIKILVTRANEIVFWHNNCLYYVGVDVNLNNDEMLELVRTIIKTC